MTLFTLIVSTASKPLRGRFTHAVTMIGNQVMVTVIHTHIVMLSEAKHLAAWLARPFAEFTLERSEGLRVTHFGNFSERLWGRPTFLSITSRLTVH